MHANIALKQINASRGQENAISSSNDNVCRQLCVSLQKLKKEKNRIVVYARVGNWVVWGKEQSSALIARKKHGEREREREREKEREGRSVDRSTTPPSQTHKAASDSPPPS